MDFAGECQCVVHDERVIHSQLVDGAKTFLHAGERLRINHVDRRLLTAVLRRVAVYQCRARIE